AGEVAQEALRLLHRDDRLLRRREEVRREPLLHVLRPWWVQGVPSNSGKSSWIRRRIVASVFSVARPSNVCTSCVSTSPAARRSRTAAAARTRAGTASPCPSCSLSR